MGIGEVYERGHHEGRGSHDGGSQGAGRGGAGLNRAGIFRAVPAGFHGRDGDRAGREHVGDRTAAQGAEEGAREHGYLGRTPAGLPDYAVGQIE